MGLLYPAQILEGLSEISAFRLLSSLHIEHFQSFWPDHALRMLRRLRIVRVSRKQPHKINEILPPVSSSDPFYFRRSRNHFHLLVFLLLDSRTLDSYGLADIA